MLLFRFGTGVGCTYLEFDGGYQTDKAQRADWKAYSGSFRASTDVPPLSMFNMIAAPKARCGLFLFLFISKDPLGHAAQNTDIRLIARFEPLFSMKCVCVCVCVFVFVCVCVCVCVCACVCWPYVAGT
jgi:hypothetical protein